MPDKEQPKKHRENGDDVIRTKEDVEKLMPGIPVFELDLPLVDFEKLKKEYEGEEDGSGI